MKSSIINFVTSGMIVMLGLVGLTTLAATPVAAGVDCSLEKNKNVPTCAAQKGVNSTGTQNNSCGSSGTDTCGLTDVIKTVINVLLFIIGSLSVIMIIVGGIRYVVSNGDSSQITNAKNTIMYAVVGLIIALLAYAIVNFVVTQFT